MKARVVAQNKKYLVEFKSDEQMITFLTNHSHKIQKFDIISENEVPAMKKSFEMQKVSQPTGWKTIEKSSIVNKEKDVDTKCMKLGGKYNTFKYEPDASLESNTSNKNSEGSIDSPALNGNEPKAKSVEDTKEFKNKSPKTEEDTETEEKEIKESVEDKSIDKEEYEFGYTEAQSWFYNGNRFDHYDNDEVSDDFWEGFCDGWHDAENDINKFEVKESVEDTKKVSEGVKDYLPRGGFIKDDESGHKEGIWGGQGTDEQIRKAKLIAKVKHANGDRMGRVTKEDLDNYEYYLEQYQEIFGLDESKKSVKKTHICEDNEFEKTHECSWCGEEFPESDMKCEKDMGWLCKHDWKYLESKEGDLEECDPTEIGLDETVNTEKLFDLDDKIGNVYEILRDIEEKLSNETDKYEKYKFQRWLDQGRNLLKRLENSRTQTLYKD